MVYELLHDCVRPYMLCRCCTAEVRGRGILRSWSLLSSVRAAMLGHNPPRIGVTREVRDGGGAKRSAMGWSGRYPGCHHLHPRLRHSYRVRGTGSCQTRGRGHEFPDIRAARTVEDSLYLVVLILWVAHFLALYRALRETRLAPALFGSVLGIVGLGVLAAGALPHVATARSPTFPMLPGRPPRIGRRSSSCGRRPREYSMRYSA